MKQLYLEIINLDQHKSWIPVPGYFGTPLGRDKNLSVKVPKGALLWQSTVSGYYL
eukprot:SAG31_NODE_2566_length_5466_cov_6.677846_1_plen_55_part_00